MYVIFVLKYLNPIFTYLETYDDLLRITKIKDDKKLTIELGLIDWLGLLVLASDSYKESEAKYSTFV